MPDPFIEHPTGDFDSAVLAIEDAIRRLRGLSKWDQWITFAAQGEGSQPDTYEFYEIRMLGDEIDVGSESLDVAQIVELARTGSSSLVAKGGRYSIAPATPAEVARIFDTIFRSHFHIRPFAGEDDDYAVGAEW
jgi:hypothetical protein